MGGTAAPRRCAPCSVWRRADSGRARGAVYHDGVPLPTGLKNMIRRRLFGLGVEIQRFPQTQTQAGLLKQILTMHRVDAVVDVGANGGQFGLSLRRLGYDGPIVSFEPIAEVFAVLQAEARRLQPWSVHDIALGSAPDVKPLNVVADSSPISSFLAPTASYFDLLPPDISSSPRMVKIDTLDSIAPGEPHLRDAARIFLKTDTQGFDLEVIRGARATLERVVATQMELSVRPIYHDAPDWQAAIAEMEGNGFVLAGLFPVNTDPWLRLIDVDAVFVRDQR